MHTLNNVYKKSQRKKCGGGESRREIHLRIKKNIVDIVQCMHGRRAFHTGRSQSESAGGLYGSENAGMSSANYVRIIMAESLRFLKEGSSASR